MRKKEILKITFFETFDFLIILVGSLFAWCVAIILKNYFSELKMLQDILVNGLNNNQIVSIVCMVFLTIISTFLFLAAIWLFVRNIIKIQKIKSIKKDKKNKKEIVSTEKVLKFFKIKEIQDSESTIL